MMSDDTRAIVNALKAIRRELDWIGLMLTILTLAYCWKGGR